MANIETLQELADALKKNPALINEIKENPQSFVEKIASGAPVYHNDIWIYRMVVLILGCTVLATVISGILMTARTSQELPASLIGLGSAALGALAGLLAPTPVGNKR